ncbi:MAG: sigma 54-interacting transcriptional regulator [Planctomycetota bacterium]
MARFGEFLARLRGGGDDADRGRLSAILSLNRELAQAKDRRQLLTLLVDEAVRLFRAERGFLLLPQAAPPGVRVEVARSLDRESVVHPERKVSSTVVQRALAGEGVFSEDAQQGELGAAASVADLKLRSVLAMPLRVGDEVLGCLYLDHRFHAEVFAERDLPWLMAFADQAAIVLHLHSLLAANEEQAARLAQQNRALAATVQAQQEQLTALQPVVTRAELRHPFAAIVGESPALLAALQVLDRVVDQDFPVLLWGESGTGKELAARALHDQGPRRQGPFVGVNAAAIAPALLESELFGHEKGAFTGADKARRGLFREASGGTLFLDELTEMDLELQARLLRALEERSVRPVGSDRSEPFDVRVVAATNRDPRVAVQQNRLREDLYFRLAVVTVRLPPLRERIGDTPLLARRFLADIAGAAAARALPDELAAGLARRSFAGNLRELRNLMQRLVALAGDGPLPTALPAEQPVAGGGEAPPSTFELAALERWAIDRALQAAGGNKAEAARLLGIARRTLYARLGKDAD